MPVSSLVKELIFVTSIETHILWDGVFFLAVESLHLALVDCEVHIVVHQASYRDSECTD